MIDHRQNPENNVDLPFDADDLFGLFFGGRAVNSFSENDLLSLLSLNDITLIYLKYFGKNEQRAEKTRKCDISPDVLNVACACSNTRIQKKKVKLSLQTKKKPTHFHVKIDMHANDNSDERQFIMGRYLKQKEKLFFPDVAPYFMALKIKTPRNWVYV